MGISVYADLMRFSAKMSIIWLKMKEFVYLNDENKGFLTR